MNVEEKIRFVRSTIEPMAMYTFPFLAGIVAIDQEESGTHVGTAFRFSMADHRFVISALHVMKEALSIGKIASTSVRGNAPVPLHSSHFILETALDLACYRLDQNDPSPGIDFWPDTRVETNDRSLSTDYLFVHGFPQKRARFSKLLGGLVKRSLPYGVMLREDNLPARLESHQIAMDFDPTFMFDAKGEPAEWLDPHGLSGSPVWRIGASGQRAADWKPDLCVLIGIVTHWWPDEQLLVATKASQLLNLLKTDPWR